MSTSADVISGALMRYRVMAWITGVFLVVMTAALIAKYGLARETSWYAAGWQIHGFLYAVYLLAVLDIAVRARWQPLRIVLIALSGTVPVVGLWAERVVTRELSH
jgi:integral membrane protein